MRFVSFGTKQNLKNSRVLVGKVLKAESKLSSEQYLNKLRKNYSNFVEYLNQVQKEKGPGDVAVIGNRAATFAYAANKVVEANNDKSAHDANCNCAMCRRKSWGGQLSKSALSSLKKKFEEEKLRREQFRENFDEGETTELPKDIVREIENQPKPKSDAVQRIDQFRKPKAPSNIAIAIAQLTVMIAVLAKYYNLLHPSNQAEVYRNRVLELGRQIAPNVWRYRDRDYQINENLSFKKIREQADFSRRSHAGLSGKDNPEFQVKVDVRDGYEDHREDDMRNTEYSFEQLERYGEKQGPIVKECSRWWRPNWTQRLDAEITK